MKPNTTHGVFDTSLPVYKIVINDNDESGCTTISLVDNPAVEIPFLRFSKDEIHKLSFNDEKRTISGIAMIADTPIYRNSYPRGEYYIVFTKETIRKMVEKYAKNGYYNLVNLQHQSDAYVDGVHMCESLIIDKERGLCPIEFKDCPDGSWYVSYHIEDEALWNEIKSSGHLNGFSIEVLSDMELIKEQNTHKYNMNKIFKLAKMVLKLSEYPTDKGMVVIDGEIEIGKAVFVETEEGPVEAENGEYVLEDGRVMVIEDGLIVEIRGVEEPIVDEVEVTLEETTEPVEDPKNEEIETIVEGTEVEELKKRIEELETILAERDAYIAELEGKIAEQDEKLKMSVETPITKKNKTIVKENKALKYFG
jgi:uncharacterized coiled-coil protein SlyX